MDIPGLVNTVTDWARSSQEEVIANMPKQDNGIIDLKFMFLVAHMKILLVKRVDVN